MVISSRPVITIASTANVGRRPKQQRPPCCAVAPSSTAVSYAVPMHDRRPLAACFDTRPFRSCERVCVTSLAPRVTHAHTDTAGCKHPKQDGRSFLARTASHHLLPPQPPLRALPKAHNTTFFFCSLLRSNRESALATLHDPHPKDAYAVK